MLMCVRVTAAAKKKKVSDWSWPPRDGV